MSIKVDKKVIFAGTAAVVGVLLIGGYFYASGVGVEKFENFLYDNDLSDAIRYQDASYSPLSDTITLEDVDLDLELMEGLGAKLTGNLETLSIAGARDERTLQIHFAGYRMVTDPSPEERQSNVLYVFADEPLKLIRQMGIRETRLGGGVLYDYDRDEDRLELGLALDADHIAGGTVNVVLARARKLAELKPADLEMGTVMNLGRLLQEFGRIEFVSGEAQVEDHGFLKKIAYLDALSRFRYDQALNAREPTVDAIAFQRVAEPGGEEFDGALDGDSQKALRSFHASGGDLDIQVETKRPVRLSDIIKGKKLHRDIEIEVTR